MGIINTGARLSSLLALSLMLAPQALWALHGYPVEQNGSKKNLVTRNYAQIATKAVKGTWHTAQIAGAGLLAANVMGGWRVTEKMRTASVSFWAGALLVSGAYGIQELCGTKKACDAQQAAGEQTTAQKVARGAWYTAQLGAWGYLVYRYRAIRNPNLSSRLLMGCMTGTCLSNTIFGFKSLLCKKEGACAVTSIQKSGKKHDK